MKSRRLARAVSRHDFGGFAGFVVHAGCGEAPLSRSPTGPTQPSAAPITNRIHMANTSAVPTPAARRRLRWDLVGQGIGASFEVRRSSYGQRQKVDRATRDPGL